MDVIVKAVEAESPETVSYTHLDVYKRQEQGNAFKWRTTDYQWC